MEGVLCVCEEMRGGPCDESWEGRLPQALGSLESHCQDFEVESGRVLSREVHHLKPHIKRITVVAGLSQTECGGKGGSRETYEKARGDGACDSERPVSAQLSLGRVGGGGEIFCLQKTILFSNLKRTFLPAIKTPKIQHKPHLSALSQVYMN